ncbi:MAG: hypothetical protein ACJ8IR_02080 [Alphaproteobacteria bacterium]|jgi:hypothetical protein
MECLAEEVERYRLQGVELRDMAEGWLDLDTREALNNLAANYEKLADSLQLLGQRGAPHEEQQLEMFAGRRLMAAE